MDSQSPVGIKGIELGEGAEGDVSLRPIEIKTVGKGVANKRVSHRDITVGCRQTIALAIMNGDISEREIGSVANINRIAEDGIHGTVKVEILERVA